MLAIKKRPRSLFVPQTWLVAPAAKRRKCTPLPHLYSDVILLLYRKMDAMSALRFSQTSRRHRMLFFRHCREQHATRHWRLFLWACRYRHSDLLDRLSTTFLKTLNPWMLKTALQLVVIHHHPLDIFKRLFNADTRIHMVQRVLGSRLAPAQPDLIQGRLRCGCRMNRSWHPPAMTTCHIHCSKLIHITFYQVLLKRGTYDMMRHYFQDIQCTLNERKWLPNAAFVRDMVFANRTDVLRTLYERKCVSREWLCENVNYYKTFHKT